jgi:SpoVK/Ycf46/Vps4 family AAA+-type ATPase
MNKVTLSGILNVLDGILEINGSIVIMTTNHPKKLDPALIQSGRVSMNIELTKMTSQNADLLIKKYYHDWNDIVPHHKYIPSDLEGKCKMSSNKDELKKLLNL